MGHFLNLDTWNRRPQFDFFRTYDNPFFNVCVEMDVTPIKQWTEAHDHSFFLASLYASQRAAHATEPFRYRLRDEGVWVHDWMTAGATVLRDDDTFGFGYFPQPSTFKAFQRTGTTIIADVKADHTLGDRDDDDATIHYSVLPWIAFTSFSHARRWGTDDSIPKIVFGKFTDANDRLTMPVSVEVHHALMDGLHVSRYLDRFRDLCQHPSRLAEPPDASA